MPQTRILRPVLVADLTDYMSSGELVALNVGPQKDVHAVFALNVLDYRTTGNGATFAKTKPDSPQSYRLVVAQEGCITLDIQIAGETFNIHDVQPLPKSRLLLTCCRSLYRGQDDFDKNGRVYSTDGQLIREILLGDGIQAVQATASGTIWTSFFDEGVFGNFGWSNPVGASGLVAWDSQGRRLYEFEPSDGLDSICDCYALNVESDTSTWLYYYTEFPLVHLENQKVAAHWRIPLHGSGAFAISQSFALFSGGYDRRNDFTIYELGRHGEVDEVATFGLADEDGRPLEAESVFGRAESVYVRQKSRVYRIDVSTALDSMT